MWASTKRMPCLTQTRNQNDVRAISDPSGFDDPVDRARLREMLKRPDGEQIPDEVIDGLLAGAETEQEIAGPGGPLAS